MEQFVLVFVLFSFHCTFADDISITKYKYIGLQNVWHAGILHQTLNAGNLTADGLTKVAQVCANFCTLSGAECEAFYIEEKAAGNCHLVNEDQETVNRTIGHGQDREDIYYIKQMVGSTITMTRPLDLTPPCDTDTATQSENDCAAFPTDVLTYFDCTANEDTYLGTVTNKISDKKCPGEDRILQCELEGAAADSNINANTRLTVIAPAFMKSFIEENPLRTVVGDLMTYMEMTFKGGAKEVTRIIVRSATEASVDKLKTGTFTLYKGVDTAPLAFDLDTATKCALHINLAFADAQTKAIAALTDKVRFDINSMHSPVHGRTGFKIDLFVKEPSGPATTTTAP